ncbi:MAG: hypothetical protein WKF59_24960 [Chitinophagaceae bacterium]
MRTLLDKVFIRNFRIGISKKSSIITINNTSWFGNWIIANIRNYKCHRGGIPVKSEEGKKTNFTFTLPIFSEK